MTNSTNAAPDSFAPPIPPDPVLGAAISHHPSDRLRPLIYGGIADLIISVILNFTVASIEAWWAPPLTIILMGIVALIIGWSIMHNWNREIVLFERGFSYREGSKTVYFHYEEIAALRLRAERRAYFGGLIRRTIYRFTARTLAEETITITNLYQRIAELGDRLTERVDSVLLPRLERKFAAGETIPFGDALTLNQTGIQADGRGLPWEQFGGWEVKARALRLKQPDGTEWAAIPLAEIDNITLLLHFLRAKLPTV